MADAAHLPVVARLRDAADALRADCELPGLAADLDRVADALAPVRGSLLADLADESDAMAACHDDYARAFRGLFPDDALLGAGQVPDEAAAREEDAAAADHRALARCFRTLAHPHPTPAPEEGLTP